VRLRGLLLGVLWAAGAGARPGPAGAQRAPAPPPPTPPLLPAVQDTAPERRFWVRPAASLLLPGSGQFLGGEHRGAAYVAAELYLVMRFLQLRAEGDRQAEAFRQLAFQAARRAFTTTRRDTVFEYYEQMQRFSESGEFDQDPGPALLPEGDAATYNGSVWLLARRTYWPDPDAPPDPTSLEYILALEFYRRHAVGPDFRWSWHNAALEQQVFVETIRKSDAALRRARNQLGLLLANHVVSAVDALISGRLAAAAGRPARVSTSLAADHVTVAFQVAF